MDKALKQRLVGASVLIALAVIVLPMLLGGRPNPEQQTSEQIELPARPDGSAFETRRFPLVEDATPEPATPAEADQTLPDTTVTDDQPVEAAAESLPNPEQADSAADTASSAATVTAALASEQQQAPGTEGLPPVASVEAPVTENVDLPVDVEPGQVEPEQVAAEHSEPGQPAAPSANAATASSKGRYAVQVASLASEANARSLQSKLEAKGFNVISDRIESDVGRLVRVRVGPFGSEAEATAAVKKIQGQVDGVNPRMVDLDPAAAQSLKPSDPLVRWVVQLGSFGETSNAEDLVKQVRAQNLSAYSEKISSSSGAIIYRVRVGPFLQREDALNAQQSLKSSVGINGVVMSAE